MKLKLLPSTSSPTVPVGSFQSSSAIHCLTWLPLSQEWICFRQDGTVQRFSRNGSCEATFRLNPSPNPPASSTGHTALCVDALLKNPFASSSSAVPVGGQDIYAVGCQEGSFSIWSKGHRLEKWMPDAHRGGILSLKWHPDGSSLVTGGEDGQVKVWSRSGMLRSVLAQSDAAVSCVRWSPEGSQVVYASGSQLTLKPLQPSTKQLQWKAHDGLVLAIDCQGRSGKRALVSVGEDGRYKVWDSYGRLLFQSKPAGRPWTSVAWAPQGQGFVVAGKDAVYLCDPSGWTWDQLLLTETSQTGSIWSVAWSWDGVQCSLGGANGQLIRVTVDDRHLTWKSYDVWIRAHGTHVEIHDHQHGTIDHVEHQESVQAAHFQFGHLVLVTSTQLYIYAAAHWNTPIVVPLPAGSVAPWICPARDHFALIDSAQGLRLLRYDGKALSAWVQGSFRVDPLIDPRTLSLSREHLALRDRQDEKALCLVDVESGRSLAAGASSDLLQPVFKHTLPLTHLLLDHSPQQQLVFVDKNRDLFWTSVPLLAALSSAQTQSQQGPVISRSAVRLLASMVESVLWHEEQAMLAALCDDQILVWYFPAAAYLDPDLLDHVRRPLRSSSNLAALSSEPHSPPLRAAHLISFAGAQLSLRRTDGALLYASNVDPLPLVLAELVKRKQWEQAVQWCRYVKSPLVWACLALWSMYHHEFNTAEVAYASLDDSAKVYFLSQLTASASPESRQALLALFRRQPREAERILFNAGQVWKVIELWMDLGDWVRALDVSTRYKMHVDTVLLKRARYLQALNQSESVPAFIQLSQTRVPDPIKVQQDIQVELERERA